MANDDAKSVANPKAALIAGAILAIVVYVVLSLGFPYLLATVLGILGGEDGGVTIQEGTKDTFRMLGLIGGLAIFLQGLLAYLKKRGG